MEGEKKKKSKKKLILLIVLAVAVALVAVIAITVAVNESRTSKLTAEKLNGERKVFLSWDGYDRDNDTQEETTYRLGTTIAFDTSGGLKNTVVRYSINGKAYTDNISVSGHMNGGKITSMWLEGMYFGGHVDCLSDNYYYINGIYAPNGVEVRGTVFAKAERNIDEGKLNGSFEVEKTVDTYNKSSSITGLKSVSFDGDKVTLNFGSSPAAQATAIGGVFVYTSNGKMITGSVLETGEDYIVLSLHVGTGNEENMIYRLKRS